MKGVVAALALCIAVPSFAQIDRAPLDFRVIAREQCSTAKRRDSSELGALLGQAAVEAVVGYAATLLELVSADVTAQYEGVVPTQLFDYNADKDKISFRGICLYFWHGRTQGEPVVRPKVPVELSDLATENNLLRIWADHGLAEVPLVYGEILVEANAAGSAIRLAPQILFYRPNSASQYWFHRAPSLKLAIDVMGIDSKQISTAVLDLADDVTTPILIRDEGLKGKYSPWMLGPALPPEKADRVNPMGDVTFKLVLTEVQKGSQFMKSLAEAVNAKKSNIAAAAVSELPWKREEVRAIAIAAVFDAEVEVSKAEAALAANPAQRELQLLLDKAKYIADQKRLAAGMPRRYNVTP